jgi:putative membrane protein
MDDMAWRSLRTVSKAVVSRRLDLRLEGAEFIPSSGPVIIAARHFHHLYDGCVLLSTLPRPLHILVALDWVQRPMGRSIMEHACRAASWPVVYRPDSPTPVSRSEAMDVLRTALANSLSILKRGRILLVFPEGYPTIDPGYTPKTSDTEFLPFQSGFARLARAAVARGMDVPIVPAGFHYARGPRWQVALQFGEPVDPSDVVSQGELVRLIASQVRHLSIPPG